MLGVLASFTLTCHDRADVVGESVEVGYGARLQELVRDLNLTRHVSIKN